VAKTVLQRKPANGAVQSCDVHDVVAETIGTKVAHPGIAVTKSVDVVLVTAFTGTPTVDEPPRTAPDDVLKQKATV